MSYPGYPPYQGPGSSSNYPPQQYPPYPSNEGAASSHPPYPSHGAGGGFPAPNYGGSAYPPSVGYPPTNSPYANPYPSTSSYYPPTDSPYPPGPGLFQGICYPPPTGYSPGYNASYIAPSSQGSQTIFKRSPTLVPANPFNPREDAEVLRKAMKGFGTDEKAIINVLGRRTNAQRLDIALQFKTLYGKDLIKDLKSELTGNFEKLILALMTPLPLFYAKQIHNAISGIGTDEEVLIEVLCTLSNAEILSIRQAYENEYNNSLESSLKGDTAGTFKRLMVSLCNAGRDESMTTDPQKATSDAQALLRAGELRLGTDESTFNMIMCQRNYAQLRLIFYEYQRLTGHDIEKAIKNEFSGDSEDALLAVVRSVRNQPAFFAKKIYQSIVGMGTNDEQLIRLIVTRCEIDMGDIKREYQSKYGKLLEDAIRGDCSGDYKKCLLALIGEY